jgi:hypothetical protein
MSRNVTLLTSDCGTAKELERKPKQELSIMVSEEIPHDVKLDVG